MAKDIDYGLKQGGLAAWKRYQEGMPPSHRAQFSAADWTLRAKLLRDWGMETGWWLDSDHKPPTGKSEHTTNRIFERAQLENPYSALHQIVTPNNPDSLYSPIASTVEKQLSTPPPATRDIVVFVNEDPNDDVPFLDESHTFIEAAKTMIGFQPEINKVRIYRYNNSSNAPLSKSFEIQFKKAGYDLKKSNGAVLIGGIIDHGYAGIAGGMKAREFQTLPKLRFTNDANFYLMGCLTAAGEKPFSTWRSSRGFNSRLGLTADRSNIVGIVLAAGYFAANQKCHQHRLSGMDLSEILPRRIL